MFKDLISQQVLTKESLAIDQKTAQGIYERAYQFYQAGKYEEARELFIALLVYNSENPAFLFGLAGCYFMLKKYELAAQLYLQSGKDDPHNPIPFYYAANSYWLNQDKESASAIFPLVIQTAADNPLYQEIKNRALLMLKGETR